MIIAEVGSNWRREGELDKQDVFAAIKACAEAGANVVKFQLFKGKELYADGGDHLADYELPYEWLADMRKVADHHGVMLGATVFDELALIEAWPCCDFIKFASGDLTNYHLQKALCDMWERDHVDQHMPIVCISTGASSEQDYLAARDYLVSRCDGILRRLLVLDCVSHYPAQLHEYQPLWLTRFKGMHKIGLSDHTTTNFLAGICIGLGYRTFEVHVGFDWTDPASPDFGHARSIGGFKQYCDEIKAGVIAVATYNKPSLDFDEQPYIRRGSDGKRPIDEARMDVGVE